MKKKPKVANVAASRPNYYERTGRSTVTVGMTPDERAELEAAIASVGGQKLAPFLLRAGLDRAKEINARKP